MTRAEKSASIEELKGKFESATFFYLADASTLTVEQINKFRGLCFEKEVEMKVVKNTLAKKALESFPEDRNYIGLYEALKGPTAVLFSSTANVPAKIIKDFRKEADVERPILKAAYIDSDVYFGDDQVDALANLKSKDDLIGEVITLLQSPVKNVLGALQSGGNTLSGIVKTLQDRAE